MGKICLVLVGSSFYRKYFKKVFRNGCSIILVHRALHSQIQFWEIQVPSPMNFMIFSDYWKCHRPSGTLMFDFGLAEVLRPKQEIQDGFRQKTYFGNSQDIKNKKMEKARAE